MRVLTEYVLDAGNDIYYDVTQASAAKPVVSDLLSLQPETLAAADMSNFLGKRRIECRKNNPQFSLSLGQKFIGSTKYVLPSCYFPSLPYSPLPPRLPSAMWLFSCSCTC